MNPVNSILIDKRLSEHNPQSVSIKNIAGVLVVLIGLLGSPIAPASQAIELGGGTIGGGTIGGGTIGGGTIGGGTIGGGTIGGGTIGGGQSASIGNDTVSMTAGVSVDICMPSFTMPSFNVPSIGLPSIGLPSIGLPSIDVMIKKPRIPKPYLEISLADPRKAFWAVIHSYQSWVEGLISGMESRARDEMCSLIKSVRVDMEDTYNQIRSGAFKGFDEALGSQNYTGQRLRRNYSRHSIQVTEKLILGVDSFVDNSINRTFYPTDQAMQQLRGRYISEIESKLCGYSGKDVFGLQPYDLRLANLDAFQFNIDINLPDISGLINSALDIVKDKIEGMIEDYTKEIMGKIVQAEALQAAQICIYPLVYCFCIDFLTNKPIDSLLADKYKDFSGKMTKFTDKIKVSPIPNSVSVGYNALNNTGHAQMENRRNSETMLLDEFKQPSQKTNLNSISNRILRNSKSIYNEVSENPDSLAPYIYIKKEDDSEEDSEEGNSEEGNSEEKPKSNKEKAETYANNINPGYKDIEAMPFIPEDDVLKNASTTSVIRMFEQSRYAMKEYISSSALRMLSNEMEWMENARSVLKSISDSETGKDKDSSDSGESGSSSEAKDEADEGSSSEAKDEADEVKRIGIMKKELLSKRTVIDIERKILESSLRQEVLLSVIIIAKRGAQNVENK